MDEIVRRAQAVFGTRLRGIFAFGSRVAGRPRADSDLDLGVWLEGPIRRADTWLPWAAAFDEEEPVLDPTFVTTTSFDVPASWMLEAVRAGVAIWYDPTGALTSRLNALRREIAAGTYRRRLFMGLPYYERAVS